MTPLSLAAKIAAGAGAGLFACHAWNKQSSPKKVHVKGQRVHHGAVGVLLVFCGLLALKKSKGLGFFLAGIGSALAIEDLQDANEWFRR